MLQRSSHVQAPPVPALSPVGRPTPISVIGDSHVFALSDRVYRAPWDELFSFRALYCPGLRTREFVRADGVLDDRVRLALQVGRVLVFNGPEMQAAHRTDSPHWREIQHLDDRLDVEPALVITTGSIDAIDIAETITETDLVLPKTVLDDPRTPDVCRTAEPGALPADEAFRRFAAPLEPLRAGLRILRAHGLSRIAVMGLPPISLDDDLCDAAYLSAGFPLVWRASKLGFRYKTVLLTNAALEHMCGEEGIPYVDRWAAFTDAGLARPGVLRDFVHLTEEAAGLVAAQLIDALGSRPVLRAVEPHVDLADEEARAQFELFAGRKLEDARLATLHALAAPETGKRVLHVGCGRGELSYAAATAGAAVTAIDPSPQAIAVARETACDLPVHFVCGDVTAYRHPEAFDVAVASTVLDDLDTGARWRLFANVAAMLRPRGTFVMRLHASRDPARSAAALRWQLASAFDHVVLWSGSAADLHGSLARPFAPAEVRAATDVFAIASHASIDGEHVLDRITTTPLESTHGVELSALRAPRDVHADDSFVAHVTLRNGGAETLRSFDPYPVRIAYDWSDAAGTAAGAGRARIEPAAEPGSRRDYALAVRAPSQPGAYAFRVTVVQESVRWFDTSVDMTIDVV